MESARREFSKRRTHPAEEGRSRSGSSEDARACFSRPHNSFRRKARGGFSEPSGEHSALLIAKG